MKTVEIKIYQFDELSEESQQVAIKNFRENCPDYYWYCFIYESAKDLGIEIESFDIDSRQIELKLFKSFEEIANNILFDFFDDLPISIAAKTFLENKANLISKYSNGIGLDIICEDNFEQYDEEIEEIDKDFKNDLENIYLLGLRNEWEYQQSDEYIIEHIQANEYNFTEDGEIY